MLPLVLVLLITQGVFAAPSVIADFYEYDGSSTEHDNGALVNSFMTDGSFAYIDGGVSNFYSQILFDGIKDLSNLKSTRSQAIALLQALAFIGEQATGIPGDSCSSAILINAYVRAVQTGNWSGVGAAIASYVQRVGSYIDAIVRLVINPNVARFSTGPSGNCIGGGRTYQFEEAWRAILDKSTNYQQARLLNEEYCDAKRLYTASDIRSNNIAAAVTAATVEPILKIGEKAIVPLAQFFRAVTNGDVKNLARAGEIAKSALKSVRV